MGYVEIHSNNFLSMSKAHSGLLLELPIFFPRKELLTNTFVPLIGLICKFFMKEGKLEGLVEHAAYFQLVEKFYFFHFPLLPQLSLYFYMQEDNEE